MRLQSVEWFDTPQLGRDRGTLVFQFNDERFAVEKRQDGWWLWRTRFPGPILSGVAERDLLLHLFGEIGWEL